MVRTIASRPHASIRDASHPGPVDGPLPGSLHPADVAAPAGAGRRIHSRSRTTDRHLGPEHHGAAGEDHLHQLPSCAAVLHGSGEWMLYISHKDDPDTPLEEILQIHADLIRDGEVRAIGASNYDATRLRQALDISARLGLPCYESLQPEYNLYDRAGYETALESLCVEHGLGVTPYYALASGFLTGKYRSESDFGQSARGQRMGKYLNERGLRVLAALDEVAAEWNATPAQVALAWLMARPSLTAPIASATFTAQLQDLIVATRLRLDADAVERLDLASAPAS